MNLIEAKSWSEGMDVRVTVCDLDGVIVYMNDAAVLSFHKFGGADLIGKSLFDCHQLATQTRIKEMLQYPQVNVYALTKSHKKQIIRQFPWVEDGKTKGIIELSFNLPVDFVIE